MSYYVQPLLPGDLERLGKNVAIVHRDISKLFPSGELPVDPLARATLANAVQDLVDETRGVTKQLKSLLEILRRP